MVVDLEHLAESFDGAEDGDGLNRSLVAETFAGTICAKIDERGGMESDRSDAQTMGGTTM